MCIEVVPCGECRPLRYKSKELLNMGLYLKKSLSVGPLRFNFSKSGIGISTGIPGFRIGMGPRGNYVHMGRGGLYYRATIHSQASTYKLPIQQDSYEDIPSGTHGQLEEIESAHVSQLNDSSSSELLNELNSKQKKKKLWPVFAIIFGMIFLFGIASDISEWIIISWLLLGIMVTYAFSIRDILNKSVVLFYEFDSEMEFAYKQLHKTASKLAESAAVWHIESSGKVYDKKYHAGASNLVSRNKTFIKKASPPYVKTNIETVSIGVGRQILHFFPDRILVYDTEGVGAVGYSDLSVDIAQSRFIEDESVPIDAKIVDRTWKHVNKNGGPDKRFKDNKELPICMYENITLSSKSGLNELIQISGCGYGDEFSRAIYFLGIKMPKEGLSSKS